MLRRLGTILKWVILLPILAAVLALAVANGETVTIRFNPFDRADPELRLDLPLYQLAFILFVFGALVGGIVAWAGQLRQRRRERARRDAAVSLGRLDTPTTRTPDSGPLDSARLLPRPGRG